MIEIIKEKIDDKRLRSFLNQPFSDMIKFVVDVDKKILALGGEMHSDQEQILLESGSKQENLWGGNIYPNMDNKLEYTSLINIRPIQNNRSLEIQSNSLKKEIREILIKLLPI